MIKLFIEDATCSIPSKISYIPDVSRETPKNTKISSNKDIKITNYSDILKDSEKSGKNVSHETVKTSKYANKGTKNNNKSVSHETERLKPRVNSVSRETLDEIYYFGEEPETPESLSDYLKRMPNKDKDDMSKYKI